MEQYWILKLQKWLVFVLLLSGFTNFLKSAVAEASAKLFLNPFEKGIKHHDPQGLKFAYADKNVVFVFEPADSEIISELVFTPVAKSESWKFRDEFNDYYYTEEDSPIVYLIKRKPRLSTVNQPQSPSLFSNLISNFQHNNTIFNSTEPTSQSFADEQHFVSDSLELKGKIDAVTAFITNTYKQEIQSVVEWNILDILIYDNLTRMENTETAQGFIEETIKKTADINRGFMFFEWYLPIYTKHGGSKSITNFMNLFISYSNPNNSNYYLGNETMGIGEFVHIWSEATTTDLRYLVDRSSRWRWSSMSSNNFESARKKFMTYNYSDTFQNLSWATPPKFWKTHWNDHTSNLTLRHYEKHVAYYYDQAMPSLDDKWPHQFISDSWRYVRNTYQVLDPNSILHIIFHTENVHLCKNGYFGKTFDYRFIIDCASLSEYTLHRDKYSRKSIIIAVGYNILLQMLRDGSLPATITQHNSAIKQNIFFNIFVYDIYLGIEMKAEADKWWNIKKQEVLHYPRWDTLLFRNWFCPIYTTFNQTMALQKYLTVCLMNWPKEGQTRREMNAGEFVHFWSGAVGQDLTSLAMEGLGWTTKYNNELLQARTDYAQVNNLYTTLNSKTPQWWNTEWKEYFEATNLVYSNDQISCYFGYEINVSISWLFKLMSDSWKYAKEHYGPLSPDPILNIFLHKKNSVRSSSKQKSYIDAHDDNRNVIDCEIESAHDNEWNFDSFENQDGLLEQLGSLILCNAGETLAKWPRFGGLRWSMVPILVYDIYKGIGMTEDAKRWLANMLHKTEIIPVENSFWFRDWYYPIYQKYGETLVLNRFLSIVYINGQPQDWNNVREYNIGEMVHLWSSAVGENLWPLADKAFGCCSWDQKTYLKARKEYPNLNYTDTSGNSTVMIPSEKWINSQANVNQGLILVHVDQHLAVYFDQQVNSSIAWPFESISMAWRYAKKTYGPIEPSAIFHLLILSTKEYFCKNSGRYSYRAQNSENRRVMTCEGFVNAWNPKDRLTILHKLSEIVLNEAKKTAIWPFFFVPQNLVAKIITFDINYEIGNSLEAITMLNEDIVTNYTNYQTVIIDAFWTRDWFYPIYANYGKANVFNNFLNLLAKHWLKAPIVARYVDESESYLNIGEFVHFWSGAAGVNLMYLANKTLQWNEIYNIALKKARKSFPMLTYSDAKHKAESNSAKIVLTENEFRHSELLLKVHSDLFISIYFDADVNKAVEWPIDFISQAWAQTKSNYDTVHNTLDPHVNIILHGTKHVGCRFFFKSLNSTEQKSILDCGKAPNGSNAWMRSNQENRHDLTYGFAKLIQHSAQQTKGTEAYDPIPFSQILAFDIFLRLGNLKDAHRLLQKNYDEKIIKSRRIQFLVRNWYLPLYTKHGGVNLLNNFVTLLSTTWAQQETLDANQKMNVGQTIHFWSASAKENLNSFFQLIFGRNQLHQVQFSEAMKEFPLLCDSSYNCEPEVTGTENAEKRTTIIEVSVFVGFVCIVFIAVLIPIVIYRKKLERLQQEMRELTAEEMQEFFEGSDNPDDGDNNFSIESKPFNTKYEIPRERLNIDFESALGSGEFGFVYRGLLKPSSEQSKELIGTVVAVKTVKPNVNVTHFKTILTELKVMGYLGSHANIVSLLGAYTVNIRKREVYMVLEFCSKGDLLTFLKLNRTDFENWIAKIAETTESESNVEDVTSIPNAEHATILANDSKLCLQIEKDVEKATTFPTNVELDAKTRNLGFNLTDNVLSTIELLKWSSEIASGMDFIACKNVIHGDLAARNVLLTEGNVSKISDFGLSRQLENYAFYMKTSKTPVPWRWMAIESLRDMKFSIQSDAWSFGVVLYEIFSLGTMPYAGCAWDCEFIDKLVAGNRLGAPEFGNEEIYKLMMDCMQKEASERVTFPQIICRLEEIKVKICQKMPSNAISKYLKLTL